MLYEFIGAFRTEILDICLDELKHKYPDRADSDLLDHIPAFLDEVTAALRGGSEGKLDDVAQKNLGLPPSPSHGVLRKEQGFDVSRLIYDFGLVCEAITTAALRHNENPDPREYQILNRCIDAAASAAVESFSEQRAQEDSRNAQDLGMLAHEIRNSISNALIGYELIRQGRANVHGMTGDVVQRALARIAVLVTNTQSAARSLGGATAQRDWHPIASLFAQIVQDLHPERGVRVISEIEEGLTVDVDVQLISSAVSNLMQNAVKSTRDNETVKLSAFSEAESVVIEVEDRCGGLPDGSAEELFRPFVRKSADPRGSGLGLAIARRAVEAHGGTLCVRNLPEVGCVFSARIPRTTRVLDKAERTSSS